MPVLVLIRFERPATHVLPPLRHRRRVGQWAIFAAVAALVMVPWFTYNYVYLGRFTLSPAGGIGRGLWEGSWQGRWRGKLHDELTQTAAEGISSDELDARVRAMASNEGVAPDAMLSYVHEWRERGLSDHSAIWADIRPLDAVLPTRARD